MNARKTEFCVYCKNSHRYDNFKKHLFTSKHLNNKKQYEEELENKKIKSDLEKKNRCSILDNVIDNFSKNIKLKPSFNSKNKIVFNNDPILSNNFRMIISGKSYCGKTYLTLQMILKEDFIDYNNLIIFSQSINKKEFQLIHHGFNNGLSKNDILTIFNNTENLDLFDIDEICERYAIINKTNSEIKCYISNDICDQPEINKNLKTLIIFDDVSIKDHSSVVDYFDLNNNNINIIYISQSYYNIPKNIIRDNSNIIILFKQDKKDVEMFCEKIGSSNFKEIHEKLISIWKKKYSYIFYNSDKKILKQDIFETNEDAREFESDDESEASSPMMNLCQLIED